MIFSIFLAGLAIANLVCLKTVPSWKEQVQSWLQHNNTYIAVLLFINLLLCIPKVNLAVIGFGAVICLLALALWLVKKLYTFIFEK